METGNPVLELPAMFGTRVLTLERMLAMTSGLQTARSLLMELVEEISLAVGKLNELVTLYTSSTLT